MASDVAAAYYVRARREDRPDDLLRAFDAVEQPTSSAGWFNRALAAEALGLTAEAIGSWNKARDDSPWTAEAGQHRHRLLSEVDAATQWTRARTRLPHADLQTTMRLIAPFHASAERYVEEELLPQSRLDEARRIAAAFYQLSGDRFLLDVVNVPASYEAFAKARRAERAFSNAATDYETAIGQLGRNPLSLLARRGLALARHDATLIEPLEREAQARQYGHFIALIHGTRAYFFTFSSRYPEALAESTAAIAEYGHLHDQEDALDARMRRIGLFGITGQTETAWSEALWCVLRASDMVEEQTRHIAFGEAAAAAVALGHANIGLRYQNTAIALIRKALREQPMRPFKINLGIALRARAGIFARLAQYNLAANDIAETIRLQVRDTDKNVQQILQARLFEVEGQAQPNPERAVVAFTNAFKRTSPEYRTYRAALLAERAKAERKLGRGAEADRDLRAALSELNAEETAILEHRERGKGEELWSSYFSRFQETYRLLIQQTIDAHPSEAFAYAERARAFEPLDLILHLDVVPQAFRGQERALCTRTERRRIRGRPLRTVREIAGSAAGQVRSDAETARHHPRRRDARPPLRGPSQFDHPPLPDSRHAGGNCRQREAVPLLSAARPRAPSATSLLVIGDPAFDPQVARGLERLPRAKDEVQQIYALYAPDAQLRVEADATVPAFIDLARKSAVVHIAAHGIVDPRMPSHSALLLAPSDKSSGLLDAQAMLTTLHLDRTRLVVLSACSSAGGLPVGPEGLAPLVRPLIAGGVPAVLGSLWDVDDATAAQLLVSFHRRYREGLDAASALQAAQRDLLQSRNAGLRSALAWAPFQVIGYGSSPFKKKEKPP